MRCTKHSAEESVLENRVHALEQGWGIRAMRHSQEVRVNDGQVYHASSYSLDRIPMISKASGIHSFS